MGNLISKETRQAWACLRSEAHRRKMKSEQARLKTFSDWEWGDVIDPRSMAAAGFYLDAASEVVRCPFCKAYFAEYKESFEHYKPVWVHFMYLANDCPFIRGEEVGNIPLPDSLPIRAKDFCGEALGISLHNLQTCRMGRLEQRMASYEHVWMEGRTPTPLQLAQAGFYYTGFKGDVRCFYCGVTVEDWSSDESPWYVHLIRKPHCPYMKHKVQSPIAYTPTVTSGEDGDETGQSPGPATVAYQADDALTCKVCLLERVEVVFLPCTHLLTCHDCAYAMRTCPVCRSPIIATTRVLIP